MNAPPPRFLRHALTMQQNLGRMMADLAVAEGEEVEGNGSPKKKELKIIKKKVRFDRVLSNSALRLRPTCCTWFRVFSRIRHARSALRA